jgi:hypothetical protein
MAALQTFDQALADSAAASGKEWSDEASWLPASSPRSSARRSWRSCG